MRVSVIGLGKLGLPIAIALANRGVDVVGMDKDERLLRRLREPTFTCPEPQVTFDSMKQIQLTNEYRVAIGNSDLSLIIVPTPSGDDDQFSNDYVINACAAIGHEIYDKKRSPPHTVVIVSTVMPGSMDGPIRQALEESAHGKAGTDFHLLYNPQFVALGSVIFDFTMPDVVLIGKCQDSSAMMLMEMYDKVLQVLPRIAVVSAVNAEIAKLGLNCAVSAKITFANQLASIAERIPGADIDAILGVIGCDSRIGHAYLRAAVNYGGPCFPRDVRAMAKLEFPCDYFTTLADSNDRAVAEFSLRVEEAPGTVGILGVSYKVGTPVVDEALGFALIQTLDDHIILSDDTESPLAVVRRSDTVVVCLPDERYKEIPVLEWSRVEKPRVVFDVWRILPHLANVPGIDYRPTGVGPKT